MNKKFDRWEFIARWLPDYSSNDDVLYSDDLDCYINGQTDNSNYERFRQEFPNVEDAIIEQEVTDCELFLKAYQHYIQTKDSNL